MPRNAENKSLKEVPLATCYPLWVSDMLHAWYPRNVLRPGQMVQVLPLYSRCRVVDSIYWLLPEQTLVRASLEPATDQWLQVGSAAIVYPPTTSVNKSSGQYGASVPLPRVPTLKPGFTSPPLYSTIGLPKSGCSISQACTSRGIPAPRHLNSTWRITPANTARTTTRKDLYCSEILPPVPARRFTSTVRRRYQEISPRTNAETEHPTPLESFSPTTKARLGDVILARSGDKGANINLGVFVRKPEHYPWLQSFMTCARLQGLIGDDWKENFYLERVEFKNILAVHFVIYGPLERGVSSTRHLDGFGKGFADYIRAKVVEVPQSILADMDAIRYERRTRLLKGV